MNVNTFCVLVSSISFYVYVISYFTLPHMKNEFERFKLAKIGLLTVVLEFLGATGLIVGLMYNPLMIVSSLGLALLMFFGLIVRIKLKDSLWISLPAIFYMSLNGYLFYWSIQ